MGIEYAMKPRSDLRKRDLVVAATVGLPQSVPRRLGWDVLDECVGLLASTEKSARTVVLDDPGPCGCRSIPGGLKLKSQIERLHPKSEPVPRCCMSDWHGKIQIHENQ